MARKNASPAPIRPARDRADSLHPADRALRLNSKEFLPDELHAGFDGIVSAFALYEAGKDDEARAALEPIGLRSPFLEWKVLLRGLLAHAANDDARAAENFARLNPERLPFRLAAPYRAASGPVYEKLNSGELVDSLRAIARNLGRERPLRQALRATADAVPLLKKDAPHLVPRLAACLQHAIIRQGEPEDLATFRKLFAAPADDPSHFKLQARIAEEIGKHDVAVKNWTAYESWLAMKPAGWPDALRDRVRAHIWHHIGVLSDAVDQRPEALVAFRRAVELAPDWAEASRELYGLLTDNKQFEDAELVVRATLIHQPDALEPLLALADNLRRQGRYLESLEVYRRASAVNPLDAGVVFQSAIATMVAARSLLFDGKSDEAAACIEAAKAALDKHMPSQRSALLAVIAKKAGDSNAHARHMAALEPRHWLSDSFRIAVDSQLAKLKPKDRKAADAAFAQVLAELHGPAAVMNLLLAWEIYRDDTMSYRGQKTQEKKFIALVPKTLDADAPESEFEALARYLSMGRANNITKKYFSDCMDRFPRNPSILMHRVEMGLRDDEPVWLLERWLEKAKELAAKSPEPRHRELLPRIEELMSQLPTPFSFLDAFFNRDI